MESIQELLAKAREEVLRDAIDGVQTASTDGTTTTLFELQQRLDAIEEIERKTGARPIPSGLGLRSVKLIPQGGGASQ